MSLPQSVLRGNASRRDVSLLPDGAGWLLCRGAHRCARHPVRLGAWLRGGRPVSSVEAPDLRAGGRLVCGDVCLARLGFVSREAFVFAFVIWAACSLTAR